MCYDQYAEIQKLKALLDVRETEIVALYTRIRDLENENVRLSVDRRELTETEREWS